MTTQEETVTVLGVPIQKAKMPEIYRLAKIDSRRLRLVLEGVMAKRGFKDPIAAIAFLERDLE